MRKNVLWTISELVEVIRKRQLNEYDANIAVTGKRGDGKSSFINKLFLRFKDQGFNQWKHQVYSRDDVIKLLKEQKFKFCWDDEGINTSYKRNFQDKSQQELIKIITAFRDNFNIYATAIPFFYSLDKDLRELIFLHVHIIERGLGAIFMPLQDSLYQQDPWDTKNNAKLEEMWQKRKQKDPKFKFPWHKLSTFVGYIKFNDLTKKQRELYKQIKREKRKVAFDFGEKKKEPTFYDKVYKQLIENKLTKTGLQQICLMEGKKYSATLTRLNGLLKDNGIQKTSRDFLIDDEKQKKKEIDKKIKSIVPDI